MASSCNGAAPEAGYTCYSLAPWSVGAHLAYGFAAVPADGDICGRCYQLDFVGTSHDGGNDPGSEALDDKAMIVQAMNIGFDVGGGQFDLLIPGGGVGAFDACTTQWGVQSSELGATYGGFLLQCKQEQNFDGTLQSYKDCVSQRCTSVFDEPGMSDLLDGCEWFVDWFEVADNPNLVYAETECPNAITSVSGVERGDVGNAFG